MAPNAEARRGYGAWERDQILTYSSAGVWDEDLFLDGLNEIGSGGLIRKSKTLNIRLESSIGRVYGVVDFISDSKKMTKTQHGDQNSFQGKSMGWCIRGPIKIKRPISVRGLNLLVRQFLGALSRRLKPLVR